MRSNLRRAVLSAGAALVLSTALAQPASAACDPIDPAACLLPFPNDFFTKPDRTTDTGKRLNLGLLEMPRNVAGKPIDPTDYNRNDGWSPGSPIVARVPGLDNEAAFAKTGIAPITDPRQSLDPDHPVAVVNARTGERQLLWGEPEYPDELSKPASVNTLTLHPAKNLEEGERYIVALRNLRRADGSLIPAPKSFAAIRDRKPTLDLATERRRKSLDPVLSTLEAKAGIRRSELYLAWDFTVASERNLSERMLHIRDDAFAQLGDRDLANLKPEGRSPSFLVYPDLPGDLVRTITDVDDTVPADTIDGVEDFAPCGDDGCQPGESDQLVRRVQGRVLVPCYLPTLGCVEGAGFLYRDGLPLRVPGNVAAANFICNVPRTVLTQGPAKPTLNGHGLLGDATGVNGGSKRALAFEQHRVMCATDWIGMATEDVPNAVSILADLSRFNSLADRVQQGMLNFLFLGRAMIHPDGFASHPAFQIAGRSVIDTERLYYDGGSQGGIIGGSLTAVAPDFTRAALGVPAMNYSILLQRSIDFDTYAEVMYRAYPDELERPLLLGLVQLLWDRAEANGYAHHMTSDPYPNTPPHEVILDLAWGDHQVTNWAALVEARTIGARLREPILDPGRVPGADGDPFFDIERIAEYPATGSLVEIWDVGPLRTVDGRVKGTNPPPVGNVPNREGVDPHGPDASETVHGRAQVGAFLQPDAQSRIIDVCGAAPCYLDGWTGP